MHSRRADGCCIGAGIDASEKEQVSRAALVDGPAYLVAWDAVRFLRPRRSPFPLRRYRPLVIFPASRWGDHR